MVRPSFPRPRNNVVRNRHGGRRGSFVRSVDGGRRKGFARALFTALVTAAEVLRRLALSANAASRPASHGSISSKRPATAQANRLQRVGALLQVFPCTIPAVVGARAPKLG